MRLWDDAAALKRLCHWLYVCVLLCLLIAAGVWVVNSPYFPIKQVKVATRIQRVDTAQVQSIIRHYLQGNIFKADVNGAQKALTRLPWVAQARVKRLWPDTVELTITERVPVARWHNNQLVDDHGNVFNAPTSESFPLLTGANISAKHMVTQLNVFEELLRSTGLHITELILSDRSAWTLVLNNGITVRLGRDDENKRLQHFVWAWPRVLREQAADIDYVDMCYRDGFALRHRSGHAPDNNQTEENRQSADTQQDKAATQALRAAQAAD